MCGLKTDVSLTDPTVPTAAGLRTRQEGLRGCRSVRMIVLAILFLIFVSHTLIDSLTGLKF